MDPKLRAEIMKWIEAQRFAEGELGGRLQAPEFRGGDISASEESTILRDIERRIGKQTQTGIRRVGHTFGARGSFRSGLRKRAERDVIKGGSEALSTALAQFYTGKAGRISAGNIAGSQFDLNKFRLQFQKRQNQLGGLGRIAGEFGG